MRVARFRLLDIAGISMIRPAIGSVFASVTGRTGCPRCASSGRLALHHPDPWRPPHRAEVLRGDFHLVGHRLGESIMVGIRLPRIGGPRTPLRNPAAVA
jgi:hypothetical protein